MTETEILTMKPGLKLNLVIATEIFDWRAWEEKRGQWSYVLFQKPGEQEPYKRQQYWETIKDRYRLIDVNEVNPMKHVICGLKDWSTDISAAWELRQHIHDTIGGTEIISICDELPECCKIWNGKKSVEAKGETVPHAICLAALLAKGR